jgi:sarcosine oxidase subunit alpha
MRHVDVAIVGAGIAGIATALAAAESRASVLLIDEQPAAGGRLRWTIDPVEMTSTELQHMRGFEIAAWADRELEHRITYARGAIAWGLFEENVLAVTEGESSYQVRAGAIIIATGGTDVTHPFHGWELPGVMTSTAFLKAVNLHRVRPGRRAAVIGVGPYAEEVCSSAELADIEVATVLPSSQDIVVQGVQRAERIESVGVAADVDHVIIAIGRQPDPELALQALCDIVYSERDGCHVAARDATLQTSIPGVYVVGDAAGNCSADEAYREGRIAGFAATQNPGLQQAIDALELLRPDASRSAG